MNNKKTVITLSTLIIILSGIAALTGLLSRQISLNDVIITSFGESIQLYQKGLYARDSVSMASQAIAQDLVTLIIGIPILSVALYLVIKENKKGLFLITGTAGYFLYTYTSYALCISYNNFYLIYVAIMILSFYLFIFAIINMNKLNLKEQLTCQFHKKHYAIFLFITGFMLTMMWLGRIVPTIFDGSAPQGLEQYSTLGIQTLDLGFVVPACFIACYLLMKEKQFGYLLTIVFVVKALTMTAAVSAMTISMHLNGVTISIAERLMFPTLFLISIIFMIKLFKSIKD